MFGNQRVKSADAVAVPCIGFGTMPLCVCYPSERPTLQDAASIIHSALDAGIRFFDTADSYCKDASDMHYGEKLLAKALSSYRDQSVVEKVVVATKGGMIRPGGMWRPHCSPSHLTETMAASTKALERESIVLWQMHHFQEDRYRLEDSLAAVKEAVDAGRIRFVGLCNVSVQQIERARRVVDIVSVQNQLSLWNRKPERDGVLEYCLREKLVFMPHGCLGGTPARKGNKSLNEFPTLLKLANQKHISPQVLVLAYFKQKWPCILHIPGARSSAHIQDCWSACSVWLTSEEMKVMDSLGSQGRGKRMGR